jgi:hypothetical protein
MSQSASVAASVVPNEHMNRQRLPTTEVCRRIHAALANMGHALRCPLCLSTLSETAVLLAGCHHAYCRSCLSMALKQQQQQQQHCPVCHTPTNARRSLIPAHHSLAPLARHFKTALRHFGLAPVPYTDAFFAMTQQPPQCHETAASNASSSGVVQEDHVQVSRTFCRALAPSEQGSAVTLLYQQQRVLVAANERALQNQRLLQRVQTISTSNDAGREVMVADFNDDHKHEPNDDVTLADVETGTTGAALIPDQAPTESIATAEVGVTEVCIDNSVSFMGTAEPGTPTNTAATTPSIGHQRRVSVSGPRTPRVEQQKRTPIMFKRRLLPTTTTTTSSTYDVGVPAVNAELNTPSTPLAVFSPSNDTTGSVNQKEPAFESAPAAAMPSTTTVSRNTEQLDKSSSPYLETIKATTFGETAATLSTSLVAAKENKEPEQTKDEDDSNNKITELARDGLISTTNVPLAVGDIVLVQSRTWPGMNKPGGVAKITAVLGVADHENNNCYYNVAFVLGGTEKRVEAAFVSRHDLFVGNETAVQRRSNNEASSISAIPSSLWQALVAEGFDVPKTILPAGTMHSRPKKRPTPRTGRRTSGEDEATANAMNKKRRKQIGHAKEEECCSSNSNNNNPLVAAFSPISTWSFVQKCALADKRYERRIQQAVKYMTTSKSSCIVYILPSGLSDPETRALRLLVRDTKTSKGNCCTFERFSQVICSERDEESSCSHARLLSPLPFLYLLPSHS